jgi:hypothetical protein
MPSDPVDIQDQSESADAEVFEQDRAISAKSAQGQPAKGRVVVDKSPLQVPEQPMVPVQRFRE